MRILVVHNRYRPIAPSGEDMVVDQESAALVERGHQVARFERHSAEIDSWSGRRRAMLPVGVLWNEESRRRLEAELVRFAPDVVHLHNVFPLITPSALHACRALRVPVVATLHNYKFGCANGELFRDGEICHDCLTRPVLPALAHGCYRGSRAMTVPVVAGHLVHARSWRTLVSAYIFISAAQRRRLEPVGLPAARSFVKHNFVPDPTEGDAAGDLVTGDAAAGEIAAGDAADGGAAGEVAGRPEVAFVGRLDPAKGAAFLPRIWDALLARRPGTGLRLVIAGSGPLEDDVARWAADRPSVTMVGHVSREEAGRLLARARAALVPSQWEETFGLVAVEAMAAGTAPVLPSRGSFPELVSHGRDGVLVSPTDPQAWADVLVDVEDGPQRWRRYGEAARQTWARRFSRSANVGELLEIYRFAMEHPLEQLASANGIPGRPERSSCQERPVRR